MMKAPSTLAVWAIALSGMLCEAATTTKMKTVTAITKPKSMISEQSVVSILSSTTAASRVKNSKAVDLAGIDIAEYLVSTDTTNNDGSRRTETTPCDFEKQVLESCIPTQTCAVCFNSGFENALDFQDGATCAEVGTEICSIAPSCSCGCEAEAEDFYKCAVEDISNCSLDCSVNPPVAPPTSAPDCDTEVGIAFDCLGTASSSCASCVDDSIDNLFAISDSVSCDTFDSKVCTAINDICNCGSCTSEVEAAYDCLYSDTDCSGLDCPATPDCDTELSNIGSCLGTASSSCLSCVDGAVEDLFAGSDSDTVSCLLIEPTICGAIQDTCNCGGCESEVEAGYICLYSDGPCDIDCPVSPPPVTFFDILFFPFVLVGNIVSAIISFIFPV